MDFLDGSDVDEDNVGDVDQDVENVLLGSDDEEAHSSHQTSKFSASSFAGRKVVVEDEEEDDVLNIMLQGEEEPLDFEGDGSHAQERVVKVRGSFRRESSSHMENENIPSSSYVDAEEGLNEDTFQRGRYVEEDEYDDDDTETRTRSRFTSERNVESYSGGAVASNSVGIPIQTVGERKIRPGAPDIRPKHWNHNGPRPNGPRYPGRNNHRYQHPGRPPMDGHHMRPNMAHQPIMQFNEGIFTDFAQPMRHPRPRQLLPGRLEPRNLEHPPHPMRPQIMNNNRLPMPPNRPPFYPERPQNMTPPRMHPGGGDPMHMQPPHQMRPDFNMRPQRARFPPNMNVNNRNPPPHMNHMQGPSHPQERPPFPPRHQRPPFRQDFGQSQPPPPGMLPPRHPNAAGFAPPHQPPHGGPPNFAPQNPYPPPGGQGPYRMGMPQQVQPGSCEGAPNQYYSQQPAAPPANFNQPRPDPAYPHEAGWGGVNEQMPSQMHGAGPWMQHNQQPQHQSYAASGYGSNALYDHTHQSVSVVHPGMVAHHPQLSVAAIQAAHSLEVPSAPITKSIYIKPNSEIHEALSKGHFLPPKSEPRHDSSSGSHYDRDRDRSSSRRGGSPSSERRRSDDDYYDDRKSYHHDRRPRRKYEETRRHHSRSRSRSRSRSPSPERKYIRSERPSERDRNRRRERDDVDHKESGKLLEEAKKMGLGEDYVKKLEEQRRLREKILKTKEQRRKLVKVAGAEVDNASPEKDVKTIKRTVSNTAGTASSTSKGSSDSAKEIEADSTVATSKGGGKPKKILRIVRDKSGKIISKKVHVVLMAKPQHEGQQQSSAS